MDQLAAMELHFPSEINIKIDHSGFSLNLVVLSINLLRIADAKF